MCHSSRGLKPLRLDAGSGGRYDEAVRATVPFIIILVIDLAIMALFPQPPLLLPHLLFDYPLPK